MEPSSATARRRRGSGRISWPSPSDASNTAGTLKRGVRVGLPAGTVVVEQEVRRRTEDYRVLDLTDDGPPCVPTLERQHRKSLDPEPSPLHVHRDCMEIIYCQRGELAFESMGKVAPFRPGMVVLLRPDEPHRLPTRNTPSTSRTTGTRTRPAPARKQENRKYFTEVPQASCSPVFGTARGGSSRLLFSCFRHGARRLLMSPSAEARFTGLTENCYTTNQSQESTCLTMRRNACCVGYWKAELKVEG